jgi:hypothetical protein
LIKVAIRAGVFWIIAASVSAQVAAPPDYLAPELKTYLKLDTQQAKNINGLIADAAAFFDAKASDYIDLEDQITTLRRDTTMEPQAIGLAVADPIAAEVTIERKVDAKVVETEKAVQALLTTEQKGLAAQLSTALHLQPLIFGALNAFILSESETPKTPVSTNAEASAFQVQSLFRKALAANKKERLTRSRSFR